MHATYARTYHNAGWRCWPAACLRRDLDGKILRAASDAQGIPRKSGTSFSGLNRGGGLTASEDEASASNADAGSTAAACQRKIGTVPQTGVCPPRRDAIARRGEKELNVQELKLASAGSARWSARGIPTSMVRRVVACREGDARKTRKGAPYRLFGCHD